MESFCEEPRCAPVPTVLNKSLIVPVVPEVSLILDDSFSNQQNRFKHMSYSAWKKTKEEEHPAFHNNNKENVLININKNQQVHFENHHSHQKLCKNNSNCKDPSTFKLPLSSSNKNDNAPHTDIKSFEEIYMANVPNNRLDLSFSEIRPMSVVTDNDSNKSNNPQLSSENCYSPCTSVQHNTSNGFSKSPYADIFLNKNLKTSNLSETCLDPPVQKTYKEYCAKNIERKKRCDFENQVQNEYMNFSKIHRIGSHNVSYQYFQNENHSLKRPPTTITTNTQTSIMVKDVNYPCCHEKRTDDPSVKDLLKIIQQQNEQLLNLQKQVAYLLEGKEKPKIIEPSPSLKKIEATPLQDQSVNVFPEKCVSSTCHKPGVFVRTPKKNPLSKFAIDVMTSFEVSIRPQPKFNQHGKFSNDYLHQEPKIQEIPVFENNCVNLCEKQVVENSDKTDKSQNIISTELNSPKSTALSLVLNESLPVHETCPSPEQSVHVDMQDFSSDSENEDSGSSDVGWTIYNNVMQQVNNILLKNKEKSKEMLSKDGVCTYKLDKNTSRHVKQATLKHLKTIGVDLSDINESTDSEKTSNSNIKCSPKEVSFAVKQLLMKYLPDEYLATATNESKNAEGGVKGKNNFIANRREFSLATVQYMKKYNLMKPNDLSEKIDFCNDTPKILDMTAIKQQPKLL